MSVLTKIPKKTTQKIKNNISNKLISGNDVGVEKDPKKKIQKNINKSSSKLIHNISMMSKINRVCSLCKIKFQTSFVINKDSSNPLKIFCSACYLTSIQNQSPPKKILVEKKQHRTKIQKLLNIN